MIVEARSSLIVYAFWRSLKHHWLYLISLGSIERLRALVEFYVKQCNTQKPNSAFSSQTSDEVYFGTAADPPAALAAARARARNTRIATSRSLSCSSCQTTPITPPDSDIPP